MNKLRVSCLQGRAARMGGVTTCRLLALAMTGALTACSGSNVSGQTGSPNNDGPPIYDTPVVPGPSAPGGGETGGGYAPGDVLPHRVPGERVHRVDDLLLVGGDGLLVVDAGDDGQLRGRWAAGLQVEIVAAPSLSEVAVLVQGSTDYSGEAIPSEPLSRVSRALVVLDVSDPASPAEVARLEVPPDVAAVAPVGDGFSLLGGSTPEEARQCGVSVGEIGRIYGYASQLWMQRVQRSGAGLDVVDERAFGSGYWQLSTDQATAFFVEAGAEGPALSGRVQAVSAESLATAYEVQLPAESLAASWNSVAIDARDGVMFVSVGSSVQAIDEGSGAVLATFPTAHPPSSVRFVSDGLVAVDAGGGMIGVDASTTPATSSWIATSGGSSNPGLLYPFGDGFLELSATNENYSYLVATLFDGDTSGGQLVARSQLVTDFPFRFETGEGPYIVGAWDIDEAAGVFALSRDSYDEMEGQDYYQLMALQRVGDQLEASEWVDVQTKYGGPVAQGDQVLYASSGSVERFDLTTTDGAPTLAPSGAIHIGLQDVWFEVEHGGYWLTKHRNSYGATRVSVRQSYDAPPLYVDVPYRVDAIVPLDDEHVAVLGMETPAECEIAAAETGEAFAECGPGGGGQPEYNGVSVLSLGAEPALVGSTPLSTFIGDALPEGAQRRIRWTGHLRLSDSRLVMLASVNEDCRTVEACDALGVVPTVYDESRMGGGSSSGSTPAGCSGEGCPEPTPEPQGPFVDGSRRAEWLIPIDLGDVENPVVGDPVTGGVPDEISGEFYRYGVEPWLLRGAEATTFAYSSVENLYDASGSSLLDEQGNALRRNYVQLFDASSSSLAFGDTVNIPGRGLLLGPAAWAGDADAEHSLFALGGSYQFDRDAQFAPDLLRLSVRDGGAYVTERLALPSGAYVGVGRGSLVALLRLPADYCAEDAHYEIRVVDASRSELSVSEPLVLEPGSWGWHLADWAPQPSDESILHVFGGPAANNGRAVVDLSGDVPEVVRYESFEW